MDTISKYIVVVKTPRGTMDVELIGSSPERASWRAKMTLVHSHYGDLDEVEVLEVRLID